MARGTLRALASAALAAATTAWTSESTPCDSLPPGPVCDASASWGVGRGADFFAPEHKGAFPWYLLNKRGFNHDLLRLWNNVTFFEPFFPGVEGAAGISFPALRDWTLNAFIDDRADYLLRLHTVVGQGITKDMVGASAALFGGGTPSETWVPHTKWLGSAAPWEVLQAGTTGDGCNKTLFVDTPPFYSTLRPSAFSDREFSGCNGVLHLMNGVIVPSVNTNMAFPAYPDFITFIRLHPHTTKFAQLLDAACRLSDPACWPELRTGVVTVLVPIDNAFAGLTPEAFNFLLNRPLLAARVIANHILGPANMMPVSDDPLSVPPVMAGPITPVRRLLETGESGLFGSSLAEATESAPMTAEAKTPASASGAAATLANGRRLSHEHNRLPTNLMIPAFEPFISPDITPFRTYLYLEQIRDAVRAQGVVADDTYILWTYMRRQLETSEAASGVLRFNSKVLTPEEVLGFFFLNATAASSLCSTAFSLSGGTFETRNALAHKVNAVLLPPDVMIDMLLAGVQPYCSCAVPPYSVTGSDGSIRSTDGAAGGSFWTVTPPAGSAPSASPVPGSASGTGIGAVLATPSPFPSAPSTSSSGAEALKPMGIAAMALAGAAAVAQLVL